MKVGALEKSFALRNAYLRHPAFAIVMLKIEKRELDES